MSFMDRIQVGRREKLALTFAGLLLVAVALAGCGGG